ncbi:Uncharacterised protein [Flavonifractor plautii]|uniref:Uncharacterized protein n=1 Tax=Flavonifractor plautii TaxID=292800 RepID=A0A173ZU26_FLAPL|nr:Uncharacterised protein [Flavonifractor plautii]
MSRSKKWTGLPPSSANAWAKLRASSLLPLPASPRKTTLLLEVISRRLDTEVCCAMDTSYNQTRYNLYLARFMS